MLCDYFLLRRTRLDAAALYDPHGVYGGTNWRAMVSLVLAVLPNLPGFINAVTGHPIFWGVFDQIYSYAWFVGLPLAVIIYYVLMQGRALPHESHEDTE
ncbi:MAG: cytosine permease, partial [Planctomycetota bacterium]|jgi:NCS1 family nucleobase:cation symporter-1